MKKNLKKTLAKVMAVALTVSLVSVAPDADAAKKPKLAKKTITVTKGKSKKVKIKNVKAKKVKKITVKVKNKKIATVKKSGKTAVKVTGKKKGSTKATVSVTLKGKKKATKLKLTVKVNNAKTPTPSTSTAPGGSTTPATQAPSQAPTKAPTQAPTKAPTQAPTGGPDTPTSTPYVAVEPTQPEKPSTPAKVLPELNLREEAAADWAKGGSYGTAIFNTDDTVTFNSEPWAADGDVKKEGNCYNNGIAWYIDAASKEPVDLSAYDAVELTIKTDAEIKMMTWAGASDAADFWSKNDAWGASTGTVENADGSKTITYPMSIFGNAKKIAKATSIGLTLKSDLDGDDQKFKAREAVIYSIKFVKGEEKPPVESGSTESGSTESGSTESGSTENPTPPTVAPTAVPTAAPTQAPEATPIVTLEQNSFTSFADLDLDFNAAKTYSQITLKIKAYNAEGNLVTADDENYSAFQGYSKITVGTSESTKNEDGTVGCGNGVSGNSDDYKHSWGLYFLNNLGKYGTNVDEDGYFTLTLDMMERNADDTEKGYISSSLYDGFGFQSTSNAAGVPKIEIYEVTFTEAPSTTG